MDIILTSKPCPLTFWRPGIKLLNSILPDSLDRGSNLKTLSDGMESAWRGINFQNRVNLKAEK
jgi:hypothetical protein